MDTRDRLEVLESRLNDLERKSRFWKGAALLLGAILIPTLIGAARVQDDGILRTKGLVIEDQEGRARIVLGAPVGNGLGRKRTDETVGMVVLGADGSDRVQIGAPTPSPQVNGKIIPRISPSAGIMICDPNGNERGGFGTMDNGDVVLGLDYPDREAVTLIVQDGYAGMMVHGENARERAGLLYYNKEQLTIFKLAGGTGWESLFWTVDKDGQPVLKTRKAKGKEFVDILDKIKF